MPGRGCAAATALLAILPQVLVGQDIDPHDTTMFDSALYDRVEARLFAAFGKVPMVWHKRVSDTVHLDVLPFPPTQSGPALVLSTVSASS